MNKGIAKLWAKALWAWIWYRLVYRKDKGYYLQRRIWVWLLIMPVRLPLYILFGALQGLVNCIGNLFEMWEHYIGSDKEKLSFRQRISYTEWLARDR